MTYQEIKDRLAKCETSLNAIANGNYKKISKEDLEVKTQKLQVLQENLKKQLKEFRSERNVTVTHKDGKTSVLTKVDKDSLDKLKKDPNVDGVADTDGTQIEQEIKESGFNVEETKMIAKKVGEAVIQAFHTLGEQISNIKATNISDDKFTIDVIFKNDSNEQYDFYISEEDRLMLSNYSYDRDIADVGVKPSGEALVNVDVVADALTSELQKIMSEMETEPQVDKKGKYTGIIRHKMSDKDKETIKQIQALLDREKQNNEAVDKYNLDVHGYETKHFEICPGARSYISRLLEGGYGDLDKKDLIQFTKLHDLLFLYEIKALKDSEYAANIIDQAEYVARNIKKLNDEMNLPSNGVDYIDSHIEIIKDAAAETDYVSKRRGEDDYKEENTVDPISLTLEAVWDNVDTLREQLAWVNNEIKENLEVYKKATNPESKAKIVDELKKLNNLKKAVEALLEKEVGNIGVGQELDPDVNEGRGDLDSVVSIIKDRANESGFEEKEEAADIIVGIAEHYNLDLEFLANTLKEGKYKSDAQRKAIYAAKAEKNEIAGVTDPNIQMAFLKVLGILGTGAATAQLAGWITKNTDKLIDWVADNAPKYLDKVKDYIAKNVKKEVVNDKDTKDLKKLSKALKGSSKAHMDQKKELDKLINTEEKEIQHDCANHVMHLEYGHGICLEGQHTLLEDGTVTHYDVFFKEGSKTVKDIPIEELEIITSSNHGHKRRKK